MAPRIGLRHITRAVSDGTGRSNEQIGLHVAAAASLTALVGLIRAVDFVKDVWPSPPPRVVKGPDAEPAVEDRGR